MKPCREWLRARSKNGYGQIRIGGRGGKLQYVHRFVWATIHGQIPAGMEICHTCDNPPCFEPDHLFLGTRLINARDAAQKGRLRGPRGLVLGPQSAERREKIAQRKREWWAAKREEQLMESEIPVECSHCGADDHDSCLNGDECLGRCNVAEYTR